MKATDPGMKRTYSGAASGKGAIYAWDGNKNVGVRPDGNPGGARADQGSSSSSISSAPFEGHNTAEFTLVPQGDATHLSHG